MTFLARSRRHLGLHLGHISGSSSQGAPALVQLLSRRGETVAVVSAAAAVGSCARLGSGGQTQVREAGALEALLPLLDGAFGSSQARIRRDIRREHHRMWARAMRSVPGAGHRAAQVGLQAAEASLGAISALLTGDRRTAAEMRQLGGLQTLVGIVGKASSRRKPSAKTLGEMPRLSALRSVHSPPSAVWPPRRPQGGGARRGRVGGRDGQRVVR